jgi:hypothetical protein
MGKRDFRHREPKKAKKDVKKLPATTILPPSVAVEVIKKRKKDRKEEGEE